MRAVLLGCAGGEEKQLGQNARWAYARGKGAGGARPRLLRPEEEEGKRVDSACAWPAEERESREFFPFSIFFSYFKPNSNTNQI